jgi:hypothetical protein
VPAARALVELLVDHLGLDAEALEIESQLSEAAADSSDVRTWLGLAAARAGDAATAHRLLRGLTGARAAEAWCALARAAADRADEAALGRYLDRVKDCDPAHPELLRLTDDRTRLQAEARRPAEQALLALWEAGDEDPASAAANALLSRWPESGVAIQVLARIRARRRRVEAERLVADAEAALSDGRTARAAEFVRRATALGAETATLQARVAGAHAAERRARDDADVATTTALLAADDPKAGLETYLALEPTVRARVREQAGTVMLDWLDAALDGARGGRQARAVDAVLAVAVAAEAAARGDDDAVVATLDGHGDLLECVARARELRSAALHRIAIRRRDQAAAAVRVARQSLDRDDLDGCERSCDGVERRVLDAAARAELDRIVGELQARREIVRRWARIDALIDAGELVAARRELDVALASAGVGSDRAAAMEARRDELTATIRSQWRVREDTPDRALVDHDPIGELLGRLPHVEGVAHWLVGDGRDLAIATANGPHVFIGRVSLTERRLVRRHYLRAPASLGGILSVVADGETVWLVGQAGHVLQVDLTSGEPTRWSSLASFLAPSEQLEHVFILPGCGHLWLEVFLPGARATHAIRVVDIDGWRLRRELPGSRYLQPLVAGRTACMVGTDFDNGAVIHTERGGVAEHLVACAGLQVSAITRDPGGELVAAASRVDDAVGEVELVQIVSGRVMHRTRLPDSCIDRPLRFAPSRSAGLVFVHHFVSDDEGRLSAFRVTDAGIEGVFAAPAANQVVLAQDAGATEVVGLWDTAGGITAKVLGAEPPTVGKRVARGRRDRTALPTLGGYFACHPHIEEHAHDPDRARLHRANEAARRDDWQQVRDLLDGVELGAVDASLVPHLGHLLGIAHLRTGGDEARAREAWQAGRRQENPDTLFRCRLEACLELIEPMPAPLPAAWWNGKAPVVRQLRGMLATADAQLADGSADGALAVMRRRIVFRCGEVQTMARLATAWLGIDVQSPASRFDKAIALSRFVAVADRRTRNLPIAGAWGDERIAAAVADAEAWLDGW